MRSRVVLAVLVITCVAMIAVGLEPGKRDPVSQVRYQMPPVWRVQFGDGDMSQICYDIVLLSNKVKTQGEALQKLIEAHPELFVDANEAADSTTKDTKDTKKE